MKIHIISEKYQKIANSLKAKFSFSPKAKKPRKKSNEKGFSLIEATVSMVVLLVAVLGVFISFTFAVSYNAGNSSRAQALAILKQRVEQMRSGKFTPTVTDSALTGGTKTPETVTSPDGNRFRVEIVVDDDPFTTGVQTDASKRLKEVSVTVTLDRPTPGWQTSVPATVVLRRVRGN